MGSASEGEVLRAVAATEVKSIWHIENTWVSVCSAKEWNDELTLLDTDTIDLNRPCREAPRELIGGVVTNHFISHIVGARGSDRKRSIWPGLVANDKTPLLREPGVVGANNAINSRTSW